MFLSLCSGLFVDINSLHWALQRGTSLYIDRAELQRSVPNPGKKVPLSVEMTGFKIMDLKGVGTALIHRLGLLKSEKFTGKFKCYLQACF